MMNLFDLHCDTAFEIFKDKISLYENDCDISLSRAESVFTHYAQVMAIWTNKRKNDEECWLDFLAMRENLVYEAQKNGAEICVSASEAKNAWKKEKSALFLGVEGARIFAGNIERVKEIYDLGVRFLTLQWEGKDVIGGSHDTDAPLTDFGRDVLKKCAEFGIIVDVSHASRAVTAECLAFSKEHGAPVIATHSNSYYVVPHTRNLTDEEAKDIASCGGVIGVSLAPSHLSSACKADILDIIKHISHYFDIGIGRSVCLGCDLDGISSKPEGIVNVADLPKIAAAMIATGFSEEDTENVFYGNAARFAARALK